MIRTIWRRLVFVAMGLAIAASVATFTPSAHAAGGGGITKWDVSGCAYALAEQSTITDSSHRQFILRLYTGYNTYSGMYSECPYQFSTVTVNVPKDVPGGWVSAGICISGGACMGFGATKTVPGGGIGGSSTTDTSNTLTLYSPVCDHGYALWESYNGSYEKFSTSQFCG